MNALTEGIYAIALTLWIGGMWAIGYLVAPTLFYSLADRTLAGALAGKLFTLIAYVGIGSAAYMLLFRLARFGATCFKHAIFWIVLLMLVLTLAGEFGVQPILAGLKDQALPKGVMESVFRDRFAAWHGVASVLYLIQSVLGVILVWLHGRSSR
jgi:hypothetical protein